MLRVAAAVGRKVTATTMVMPRTNPQWTQDFNLSKLMSQLSNNAVELHPCTDAWMRGDRYGAIIARRANGEILVRLDKSQRLVWFKPDLIFKEFSRI